MKSKNLFQKIWNFYSGGFKEMGSWGRQVWVIILVKLFIMFVILRIFFFPNFLKSNFETDQERGNHVLEVLTNSK
ncbi:MAG: DUF4492 domain-containing protein [Draconibacterium sp.]